MRVRNFFVFVLRTILFIFFLSLFFRFIGVIFYFFVYFFLFLFLFLTLINYYFINKRNNFSKQQKKGDNKFFVVLAVCLAKVLLVSGLTDQATVQKLKKYFTVNFGFYGSALVWLEDVLKQEFTMNRPVSFIVNSANREFNYELKLTLIDFLFNITSFITTIGEQQKAILDEFVTDLGISEVDYIFLRAKYYSASYYSYSSSTSSRSFRSQGDRNHHLQVLGLSSKATQEEIRVAYRQLVKKFHPDVVAYLGDDVRLASEKRMKEIQKAYEFLKET